MRALRDAPAQMSLGFSAALAAQIAWAEATLRRDLPPRQRVEVRLALRYWRVWQRRQRGVGRR